MAALRLQRCTMVATSTRSVAARVAPQTSCQLAPCTGVSRSLGGGRKPQVVRRRTAVSVRASGIPEQQLSDAASALGHAAAGLPSTLDHLAAALTPYLLTLGDVTADAAGNAAAEAANKDNGGVFGFLASGFEAFLKVLDNALVGLGVPYSYGFAIILLTIMVKAATYPLSKKQVESTVSMQALQPRVRELQAKYANNPERLQMETARLYKEAGVNPLAGCLPTLATIPVWIGLYKALSNVADEGLLTEGFFWIPSLGGPTTLAMQQEGGGLSWLFPFQDGAPPVGWVEAAAYLVLPVLLVVSQYVSQQIMTPQSAKDDPSQQQAQAILKFLPVMIGWFSLNVPSGLTLYWFTNNLLTTAQTMWLRSRAQPAMAMGGGSSSSSVIDVQAQKVEEEPSRPTGKDLNARRSKKQLEAAASEPKEKGSRGEKFKQIKAREAARKAAKIAATAAPADNGSTQHATEAVKVEEKLKVPDAPPAKDNSSTVESSSSS